VLRVAEVNAKAYTVVTDVYAEAKLKGLSISVKEVIIYWGL